MKRYRHHGRYASKRKKIDGIWFASNKEAQRYEHLKWRRNEGVITNLMAEKHLLRFTIAEGVKLPITPARPARRKLTRVYYEADFRYTVTIDGIPYDVWEDVKPESKGKPFIDAKAAVKINLFRLLNANDISIVHRICTQPTADPHDIDAYWY